MSKLSEFSRSLRELGAVRVNDWDFRGLMQRDIRDLEVAASLRKLGNMKVIDWEFESALPTVHKLAYQEVHLGQWVRKAANYKVIDLHLGETREEEPEAPDLKDLSRKIRAFVHFTAVALVKHPEQATIRVRTTDRDEVTIRLVVATDDIMNVIGRDGETASAMRRMIRGAAEARGGRAKLEVMTHEEELKLRQKGADTLSRH